MDIVVHPRCSEVGRVISILRIKLRWWEEQLLLPTVQRTYPQHIKLCDTIYKCKESSFAKYGSKTGLAWLIPVEFQYEGFQGT